MKIQILLTVVLALNSKPSKAKKLNDQDDGLLKDEYEATPCSVPSSFECLHSKACKKDTKSKDCVAFRKQHKNKHHQLSKLTKNGKKLRKSLRKARKELKKALRDLLALKDHKKKKSLEKKVNQLKKLIKAERKQLLQNKKNRSSLKIGVTISKEQTKLLKLRGCATKLRIRILKLEKNTPKGKKLDKKSEKTLKKLKSKLKKIESEIKKLESKNKKKIQESPSEIQELKDNLAEFRADTKRQSKEIKKSKDKARVAELKKRVKFNKEFNKKLANQIKNLETKKSILKKKNLKIKDQVKLERLVKLQITFMKRWIVRVNRRLKQKDLNKKTKDGLKIRLPKLVKLLSKLEAELIEYKSKAKEIKVISKAKATIKKF